MQQSDQTIRLLIAGTQFESVHHYLKAFIPDVSVEMIDVDQLKECVHEADVLIPSMASIGESIFARAVRLRLIQQWGVGLDNVEIEAASRHGIAVANVPSIESKSAHSVAEWCIMASISLSRRFPEIQQYVRDAFPWGAPLGRTMEGRTAGLIGFGGVGQSLCRRLTALGMHVISVTRHPDHANKEDFGLKWIGDMSQLSRLLMLSDYLFICVPLNDGTLNLIGEKELSMLPRGAFLINPCRGPIIERDALIDSLDKGHLGGVALDVFWKEPPDPNDPILDHFNVVATPHIAGVTDTAYEKIATTVAENIRRTMSGKLPLNCVNPQALSRLKR
ncbi:2-hydroxyacid dehydrogenase [Desulfobacterales bacterium HSG16]|nr:2-hydroxyacid dehydrogenase [Desulfobacterales bacterium HSG16]